MHIVIMGCGRVGSTLAHILEEQGYSVAIIDQDREALRKLRSGFKGKRVVGVGFDQDVLIEVSTLLRCLAVGRTRLRTCCRRPLATA